MKALLQVLLSKNILPDIVSLLRSLIGEVEGFVQKSYDPSLNYFRQGGLITKGGQVQWSTV
jgi:hypothetical protein